MITADPQPAVLSDEQYSDDDGFDNTNSSFDNFEVIIATT